MCVKERVVTKLNLGKLMAASKICAFLIYARRKMTSRVGKSKLIFTAVKICVPTKRNYYD